MPPGRTARRDSFPTEPILPSVLFWLCIFAAITVFAGVFLAPKLVALHRLELEQDELALRLDRLQRGNAFLERVIDALENDPEFTAEVARFDLDAVAPDEEHLPAPPVLPGATSESVPTTADTASPWWLPIAETITEDRTFNDACLLTAGALAVVAFTFFHPTIRPRRGRARGRGGAHASRSSKSTSSAA